MIIYGYFLIALACSISSEYIIEDDKQYEILWQPQIKSDICDDEVNVISKDRENYTCFTKSVNDLANSSDYDILSEFSNIFPSFISDKRALYNEHYWTYELRHGVEVKQYHINNEESEEPKDKHEYHLGHFNANSFNDSLNKGGDFKVVQTYLFNKRYMGIAVKYVDGSLCNLIPDISRSCQVIYICDQLGMDRIASVSEVATCAYEIIYASSRICSIPGFDLNARTEKIYCSSSNGSNAIPHEIQNLQQKQLQRSSQLNQNLIKVMTIDGQKVLVKLFLNNVNGKDTNELLNGIANSDNADVQNNVDNEIAMEGDSDEMPMIDKETTSFSDIALLQAFFRHTCIQGMSCPFWSYEFCYNRHLIHYHKYIDSREDWNITLGLWKPKKHFEWYQSNIANIIPNKNVIATLLYTDGSVCEENNQARTTIVKLICVPDNFNKSKNEPVITSTLKEEKLCSYTFSIKSRIFCDTSIKLDSNGIPNFME